MPSSKVRETVTFARFGQTKALSPRVDDEVQNSTKVSAAAARTDIRNPFAFTMFGLPRSAQILYSRPSKIQATENVMFRRQRHAPWRASIHLIADSAAGMRLALAFTLFTGAAA